ncbi:hypothetical protein [Marinobacter xestospongiae]|uniref:hypothetical protein n=1 Tax=Marinobacter xestospongiae TaxID=994319 RepID=UPI0020049CAB|nr:hypothetical protein [Marinobacter xestospongiae]MCK7565056.1 hypothetical protein [Marinobacter xestospongiae]
MILNALLAKKFYYSVMVDAVAEGIAVTNELSEPEGILNNAIDEEFQTLERLRPVIEDLQ